MVYKSYLTKNVFLALFPARDTLGGNICYPGTEKKNMTESNLDLLCLRIIQVFNPLQISITK